MVEENAPHIDSMKASNVNIFFIRSPYFSGIPPGSTLHFICKKSRFELIKNRHKSEGLNVSFFIAFIYKLIFIFFSN